MRLSEVKSLNLSLVCLRVFASFIGIAGAARTPSVGRRAHAASGCKPEFSHGLCKTMDSGVFDRSRSLHSNGQSCLQVCRWTCFLLKYCACQGLYTDTCRVVPQLAALHAHPLCQFHTVTARSIVHAKQIKPTGATAKLAQNSVLSARRKKGICILYCNSGSLDHANLGQNKQSFRMSLAAGFKAGFEAASRL